MKTEHVLCVKPDINMFVQTHETGYVKFHDKYDIFEQQHLSMMSRAAIEEDENFLQLIPYVTLSAGNDVFCYERSGHEDRLLNQISIGLGGHIVIEDLHMDKGGIDVKNTVHEAAWREVLEEMGIKEEEGEPIIDTAFQNDYRVNGLLIDRDSPVGRVHLGLHIHLSLSEKVEIKSEEISDGALWAPLSDVRKMNLETWSKLCLPHSL